MRDIDKINRFLQSKLQQSALESIRAVEAAAWLDRAGLLRDSTARPGKPLRDLLRRGVITGQRQEGNRRWFIDVNPH